MAPRPKNTDRPDETSLQQATRVLSTGLGGFDKFITENVANLATAGMDALELAGDFATVLFRVAQITGELRKIEKADRDAKGDTTLRDVGEFIRRATDADKKQVARMLRDAETSPKSGLA